MKRVDRLPWRDSYNCPECLNILEISERAGAVSLRHPYLPSTGGFPTYKCSRINRVDTLSLVDSLHATNKDAQPIALLRIPKQIMGDCRLLLSDWEIMPCNMRIKWNHKYPFDTYGREVIMCRCTIIKPIAAYTIFV